MFIDRKSELEALQDEWERDNRSFIVIYGRRRVGKTSLIKEFIKDKRHVYYLATELPIEQQFRDLQRQAGNELDDDLLKNEPFTRWDDLFNYIEDLDDNFILVIDEFPYLVEAESAIPSIFQKGWDESLKNSNIDIILCGSSISMMEDEVLKSDSPLYGRKTSQLKLKDLPIRSIQKFLPGHSPEETIRYFSIFGGIPAYLELLEPENNFENNILRTVLNIDAPLKDAVDFILKTELRKPERYRGILSNLARGVNTLNGLSQAMGMEGNQISQYLSRLRTLGLTKRIEPITMSPKKRKRRGRYMITDKFTRFYFYYVLPNRSDIEEGKTGSVFNEFKDTEGHFISTIFEEIARDYVVKNKKYSKVGRWWYKEDEIDVVALSEKGNKLLLGECKWSRNPVSEKIYHKLKDKADRVRWKNEDRDLEYVLFSKSGFTDDILDIYDTKLTLVELDELWDSL